jgi:hypothetical protein
MTSTQDTKEQLHQTAGTAADEGKHVAAVVGEEAQNVAGQAQDQVRELLDDAIGQLSEQSRTQLGRLVDTLRSVGSDLDAMASSADQGLAAQLTQQVAQRSRSLSAQLEGREPSDVLDDVRRFARRRPAMFLVGALSAGVVVGRLARGAKQAHNQDSSGANGAPMLGGQSTGGPAPIGSTSAPSYGQPAVAAPPSPVEPTYPETGGFSTGPAPTRSGDVNDENGSTAGPQGFLP